MKTTFCLLFMLINGCVFAQKSIGLTVSHPPIPPQYFGVLKKPLLGVPRHTPNSLSLPRPVALPVVFSVDKLPFFCKIEHKINVQQALPVKFRLGSVEYVDKLQGKGKVKIQE
jgi:hypothetical protein